MSLFFAFIISNNFVAILIFCKCREILNFLKVLTQATTCLRQEQSILLFMENTRRVYILALYKPLVKSWQGCANMKQQDPPLLNRWSTHLILFNAVNLSLFEKSLGSKPGKISLGHVESIARGPESIYESQMYLSAAFSLSNALQNKWGCNICWFWLSRTQSYFCWACSSWPSITSQCKCSYLLLDVLCITICIS